jgi:hypothetical protein
VTPNTRFWVRATGASYANAKIGPAGRGATLESPDAYEHGCLIDAALMRATESIWAVVFGAIPQGYGKQAMGPRIAQSRSLVATGCVLLVVFR